MPCRSSIFSFKTLRLQRGVPQGLLTAVVLLALLDGAVSRQEWLYRWLEKQGQWSYISGYLQTEQALASSAAAPRVVIFGNSHTWEGLSAPTLATELNLSTNAVVNVAVSSGDLYDDVLFEKRNLPRLQQARLLVYCVDIYQLNEFCGLGYRFGHFANLFDRWIWSPTPRDLLVGVFRTVDKADFYKILIETLKRKTYSLCHVAVDRSSPKTTDREAYTAHERAAGWCVPFRLSQTKTAQFQQLLRRRIRAGQQVLVLQMPCRSDFMRELHGPFAGEYAAYTNTINRLCDTRPLFFEEAATCGLQDQDFRDCDHLTPRGKELFTHFLGEWLKQNRPDVMEAVRP